MGKQKENYGDLLSKYLVEKISGKKVNWVQPKKMPWYSSSKKNYLAAGSIIHHANKNSIVWGSGIIDHEQEIAVADFRAVRGPETRKYLLGKGCHCPEVYGDPALLLSDYFKPQINKRFKLGIIPHYNDFKEIKNHWKDQDGVSIIDMMTDNIEKTTVEILECEKIISSSLHGVIVAHAYGIPAVCVQFSDKVFGNGIKYTDYYASIGFDGFVQTNRDILSIVCETEKLFVDAFQPEEEKIQELKKSLLKVCPFKKL
ncbi:polysaccharide pyruvyl transferase family protein [Christiangramia fulva]|uniref:Polysaccharide pyruvyl transferase family protein n=2 Tax=Christiangramia fulva TaxID=2126553 RepID=A0A2R3ZAH9_9FLAO|nr:polysaccharide pyruvyl transferase family protein [Christiangramia fulva]